jgi:hypothetical protein
MVNQPGGNWIEFSDYETGDSLESTMCIPSYSQKQIRITFKPLLEGEYNFYFALENLNDQENTVEAAIHATVSITVFKPTEFLTNYPNNRFTLSKKKRH